MGLASCKPKTEQMVVQGYVKTFGSETTHEGIEIELNEEGAGVTLLDKTTSNADGWYQLKGDFDVNKTHYLYLNNSPSKHLAPSNFGYNSLQVNTGGVQNFDIDIEPFIWLNIHFKNVNPCSGNDLISFYANYAGFERLIGAQVDEYFLNRTTGNKEITFRYDVFKCGIQTRLKVEVGYVSAFDTVDVEVFY